MGDFLSGVVFKSTDIFVKAVPLSESGLFWLHWRRADLSQQDQFNFAASALFQLDTCMPVGWIHACI